jgi:lysophospholipase L1-like esterase
MQQATPVSRPAWVNAMNALTGTGGVNRKSPIEIFASAASAVTRSPYAEVTGIKHGKFGRWTDGVAELRAARTEFAGSWAAHNDRVLLDRDRQTRQGETLDPLWLVLGDSTAQGLGALGPYGGYVGQVLHQLRRATGKRWRVLNLSVSGALIRDVLAEQIPQVDDYAADLVTCGAGANDILFTPPAKLFGDLRALLAAVPEGTVVLDLPLLSGFCGIVGHMSVPYITRINRVIHEVAAERTLGVAEVSRNFTAPWTGKFSADSFHPSQDGYRDWSRALIKALPALSPATATATAMTATAAAAVDLAAA